MRERSLIFLDLETTSLIVQENEILEIGALKVNSASPFNIIETIAIKVAPKHIQNADKEALKVIHYTAEEWKDALPLDKALLQLEQFAKNDILVGYNVNFDWAVLDKAYYALGKEDPFYYHRIDVMSIAYSKLFNKNKLKRFSLSEVCDHLGIKREVKHRALDDAKATYEVFKKLMI